MNKIERDVTPKELIESMKKDILKRNKYISNFINLLMCADNNSILSLDGNWGSGKTFFVKQSSLIINYCNNKEVDSTQIKMPCISVIDDDAKQTLEGIIQGTDFKDVATKIKNTNMNAVYFNAWEHDEDEDPILSLIYSLIKEFPEPLNGVQKISDNDFMSYLKTATKIVTGGRIDIDSLNSRKDLIPEIKKKDEIKNAISIIFSELINENCNRLVIFIDELDRCNPIYAVKMLERIKHYIKDERVIVVLSTNLLELSHTISKLYGDVASLEYLDKFFDYKLIMPPNNSKEYAYYLFPELEHDSYWFHQGIKRIIDIYKMNPRNQNRYIAYIRLFEAYLTKTIRNGWGLDNNIVFLRLFFTPYIVGILIADPEEYYKFISGKGKEKLKKYAESDEISYFIRRHYLINDNMNDDYCIEEVLKLYDFIMNDDIEEIKFFDHNLTKRAMPNILQDISLLEGLATIE